MNTMKNLDPTQNIYVDVKLNKFKNIVEQKKLSDNIHQESFNINFNSKQQVNDFDKKILKHKQNAVIDFNDNNKFPENRSKSINDIYKGQLQQEQKNTQIKNRRSRSQSQLNDNSASKIYTRESTDKNSNYKHSELYQNNDDLTNQSNSSSNLNSLNRINKNQIQLKNNDKSYLAQRVKHTLDKYNYTDQIINTKIQKDQDVKKKIKKKIKEIIGKKFDTINVDFIKYNKESKKHRKVIKKSLDKIKKLEIEIKKHTIKTDDDQKKVIMQQLLEKIMNKYKMAKLEKMSEQEIENKLEAEQKKETQITQMKQMQTIDEMHDEIHSEAHKRVLLTNLLFQNSLDNNYIDQHDIYHNYHGLKKGDWKDKEPPKIKVRSLEHYRKQIDQDDDIKQEGPHF